MALAAASPAEEFVQDNIHKGASISLNNKQLPPDQRRIQFETFLLGPHRHEAH